MRENRIAAVTKLYLEKLQEDLSDATIEQIRESIRRYIRVHYGGCAYTIEGYVEEVLAKVEWERARLAMRNGI